MWTLQRLAEADEFEQARALRRALDDLLSLHRQEFPPATAPQAPPPPPVNAPAIYRDHRRRARKEVGTFQLAARKAAVADADEEARQLVDQLEHERRQQWQQAQVELDRWWAALLRNDPDVVLPVLANAFDDNEAPAVAVGLHGGEISVVVLVPGIDAMPERTPDITRAGDLTLRVLSRAERASLHTAAVASHILLTLREAFAVAPALSAARVVAVQRSAIVDAFAGPRLDVLVAARVERRRLDAIQWDQASAASIINNASTELLLNVWGDTRELRPVDLRDEPDLTTLVEQIELDEYTQLPVPPADDAGEVEAPALEETEPPVDGRDPASTRTLAVRAAVAVAWLLVLVIAGVNGVGAFLIVLGLPLLAIGIGTMVVGQARWAWIAGRPAGAAAVATGLALMLVGGVTTTPQRSTPLAGSQETSTSAEASVTTSGTTPTTAELTTTSDPQVPPVTSTSDPTTRSSRPGTSTRRQTTTVAPTTQPRTNCHRSYPTLCIPGPPPALTCADIPYRNFPVLPPDPHRFDPDKDGVGCETG